MSAANNKQFQAAIYQLKRNFPASITLRLTGIAYFDLSATGSGDILNPVTEVVIDRAIVLPKNTKFITIPGLAIPGTINMSMRQIIIDTNDIPHPFEIKQEETKVLFEDKEWDVKSLENVPGLAIQLFVQEIEGSGT